MELTKSLPCVKGAFGRARASLEVWALPEAGVAMQRCNTKAKPAR